MHPTQSSLGPLHAYEWSDKSHVQDMVQADPDSTSGQDKPGTIDKEIQTGVQKVEALATAWSKNALIASYVLIWIVYFVMLMQQAAAASLLPFVTSAFQAHSLTPTVMVISSIFGAVCNLTVAKILDVLGRPQGYALALAIATIGLVMMAATNGVKMYAAAQVFSTVGNNALLYTVGIIVADTSSLRNRGLATALAASPNIITIWLGGPISEAFLKGPGWEWAFGTFSVIVPVFCSPLLALLWWYQTKAKKQGIAPTTTVSRTPFQSIVYYCQEFDIVGLLLVTAGLALFLLSFNIYGLQPQGWQSPMILCFLIFGLAMMVGFVAWEAYFAPVTFIPASLLLDRDMIGACLLGAILFISFFCWNSFFTSFLLVVYDLTVTEASYIYQIYGLGGSLSTIATGLLIRYTGRYKAVTLYFALPVYTLSQGLMVYFRQPDMDIGYIIMCQIFISFASGVIMITPVIAAMSAASHQHVAVIVAVISAFSGIGGSIGLTVASTIWQQIFPTKLAEYLPEEERVNLLMIYGALDVQLSYPIGSPARIAIQRAYGDAQQMMLVAGTAIWILGFAAVLLWRNRDVRGITQVKGTVF